MAPPRRTAIDATGGIEALDAAWSYESLLVLRLLQGLGLGDVFPVFGLVVLVACIVVALFATETKGRVLEEISP